MLGNSFLQKIIISAVIGLALSGLVQFYRHIIDAGDKALNAKYERPGMRAPPVQKR